MRWWFRLGAYLLITVYAVWLLLNAYRVVGKPSGRTRSMTPGTDIWLAPGSYSGGEGPCSWG
jgi:hypothetical protein